MILSLFQTAQAWLAANPVFAGTVFTILVTYVTSPAVSWAFRPRSQEEWDSMRPSARELLRLYLAFFADAPKAADAASKLLRILLRLPPAA